jgi:hypothetical protein
MGVIERPESTTYVLEFPFHLIRNEKELQNMMQGYTSADGVVIQNLVEKDTYQPLVAVALRDEKRPFVHWHKFVVRLELLEYCGYRFGEF